MREVGMFPLFGLGGGDVDRQEWREGWPQGADMH